MRVKRRTGGSSSVPPYGLCECTSDGGDLPCQPLAGEAARLPERHRSAAGADFAATVFECADDLRWLLERAVETGKPQSVETLLKTRGHGRLNVRLHAMSADRTVVIAVEDLTKLNAVEQRLREAQRLEAVGRVASEVAVDVRQPPSRCDARRPPVAGRGFRERYVDAEPG